VTDNVGAVLFNPMDLLEKSIGDSIWQAMEAPNSLEILRRKGLRLPFERQISWFREVKIGSYGVVDFAGHIEKGGDYPTIIYLIELKRDRFETKHAIQLSRYARGMERWLEYCNQSAFICPILLCRHGCKYEANVTLNGQVGIMLYEYHLDFDLGISFKPMKHWNLASEGFDYTLPWEPKISGQNG